MDYEEFVGILLSHSRIFANCTFDFQDPFLLTTWYDALKDLSKHQLLKSLSSSLSNHTFFPSVAQIRKQALPQKLTPDDTAIDIASKIVTAISRFGWNKPKEAKAFIGEIGWQVVLAKGGWDCVTDLQTKDLSTFTAQCREQAKVVSKRSLYELALEDNKLLLEESFTNPYLQNALDLAMSGLT